MSRASAISREPVIKAEIGGKWIELPSQEVQNENFKVDKHFENHCSMY